MHALTHAAAKVSKMFLLFLRISKETHIGHSYKVYMQGSQQESLLEVIMPAITSHYRASPKQHGIMLSIWDVRFDLFTTE